MDMCAAGVDNHHLSSSLLSLSGAAFLSNVPRIVKIAAAKRNNSNLPEESIACIQLQELQKIGNWLASGWTLYQQGSSKVKGGIATYAKGRTDVKLIRNAITAVPLGKENEQYYKIFNSGIVPFSGCTISITFLATTETWIRKAPAYIKKLDSYWKQQLLPQVRRDSRSCSWIDSILKNNFIPENLGLFKIKQILNPL